MDIGSHAMSCPSRGGDSTVNKSGRLTDSHEHISSHVGRVRRISTKRRVAGTSETSETSEPPVRQSTYGHVP